MRWKWYFFKTLFLTFIFVILASYFLYVVIDYSAHAKLFQNQSLSLWHLFLYYFYQFSKHADVLIPISLLVSGLKVILTANVHREILVLMATGISLKKITRPFLLFAVIIMGLCYLNFEYMQPHVYVKLMEFEQHYFHKSSASENVVNPLTLEDHSLLVYHIYDPIHHCLYDLFWQKNKNELYKMDSLQLSHQPPQGYHVDHFVYPENSSALVLTKHYPILDFPTIAFPEHFSVLFRPHKWQPLSQLAHALPIHNLNKMNDKQASITTHFLYKLLMPLVTLLVICAPLCLCTRFHRKLSFVLIYALFLFGYITFFTLLNASVILGTNQILHPIVAICVPMGSLLLLFGYKYAKLQ